MTIPEMRNIEVEIFDQVDDIICTATNLMRPGDSLMDSVEVLESEIERLKYLLDRKRKGHKVVASNFLGSSNTIEVYE